ncbi:hypothetical protein Tco_0370986 [Tanacetum coccineum]
MERSKYLALQLHWHPQDQGLMKISLKKLKDSCKNCDIKRNDYCYSRLYNEFDRFTSEKGESIHSYYLRFAQFINDMNTIGMTMKKLQVNTKFVNNLQSEWSKIVIDVKLAKDMHKSSFDQLYACLRKHEVHANEVHMMRERFPDPLALVANSYIIPPYSNNHQLQYNSSQYHQQLSPIAQQFYTSLPQPQPYEAPVH